MLAESYIEQGDWNRAVEHYELALKAGGPAALLKTNLGVARLNIGQHEAALEVLKEAAALPEATPKTFFDLGVVNAALGRRQRAVEAYEAAIARDPQFFEALANLGNVLLGLENYQRAQEIFSAAIKIKEDPAVTFMLAALEKRTLQRAPVEHVQRLFDQYASSFEDHLQHDLDYHTPDELRELFESVVRKDYGKRLNVLDLGCGTGLAGVAFADAAALLIGVDASRAMLQIARSKGSFHELYHGDVLDYLRSTERRFDLFLAADVFNYFGDLTELFATIARCATAGAHLVFSVERAEDGGVELQRHARFTHSLEHVEEAAAKIGWRVAATKRTPVRVERGHEVDGLLVVQQLLGPEGAVELIG